MNAFTTNERKSLSDQQKGWAMNTPICPSCGSEAAKFNTRYGIRHSCCGLHSWGGKELVSQEIHDARQMFHAAFDRLWKTGETIYQIREPEGSQKRLKAIKKIRRSARNRAYQYVSAVSGLPEPECHGSSQTDLTKLTWITKVAQSCTGPGEVREWWHRHGGSDQ